MSVIVFNPNQSDQSITPKVFLKLMFTLEKLVYTVAALRLDVQADENPKAIQLNKHERLHHTLIRPVAVTLNTAISRTMGIRHFCNH